MTNGRRQERIRGRCRVLRRGSRRPRDPATTRRQSSQIKEANKRAKPAWYASTTPKFDDVELKDQTVYTQPPQEILDAVQDGGFEDMSESDDDGAMPAELRKVRFVEDDLDAAATLLQNSQRRRTACLEVAQKRQINSAATLLQNSERRRTARLEVAQKRQKRDDSAATMLQGSVRRRNAKQEVSQRRRKRDDGAATLLRGLSAGATPAPKWSAGAPRRRAQRGKRAARAVARR